VTEKNEKEKNSAVSQLSAGIELAIYSPAGAIADNHEDDEPLSGPV
jgi:hypothetical protein